MLARAEETSELQDRLFAVIGALVTLLGERETSRQVYAKVDLEFQHCADLFETVIDVSGIANYTSDRRLFRMYTDRIQRRAGYAKQAAQESGN